MPAIPPEQRPFRFGVLVDTRNATRESLTELAKRAEASGVSVLLGSDHLGRWSALPLLQAAAEVTSLRIGTLVLNNDFRHPALLAQDVATIDLLTSGRVEIGIGAGWDRGEYQRAGIQFDAPPTRVARMQTSVRLLKQALSEGKIRHAADDSYPAMDLDGLRLSTQRPHPPILIGGGRRQLLSFAAREANIVGLDPRSLPEGGQDASDVLEAAIDRKIGWVREAAGNRWSDLEINVLIFEVDPLYRRRRGPAPARRHGISEEELPRSPHYLVGDIEQMADQLLARRERWGISYLTLRPSDFDAAAMLVERMAGR
jgi:probable F420-dependent oxidoreductase